MFISIRDTSGMTLEQSISNKLRVVSYLILTQGKNIQQALLHTTRNHFRTIYPDSKHYDPDKVTVRANADGQFSMGSISIDVPGISRAFHDLDIVPRYRQALTIPIHQKAYGLKATDFTDLIMIKKRDGKAFLAEKNGSKLTFLYRLVKKVHQKQDRRLLPSDLQYADNIFARIKAALTRG